MIWILFTFVVAPGANGGISSLQTEFDTASSCEAARARLEITIPKEMFAPHIYTVCVRKS